MGDLIGGLFGIGEGAAQASGAFDAQRPEYWDQYNAAYTSRIWKLKQMLQKRQEYDPQFQDLNLQLAGSALFGKPGTPGTVAMAKRAREEYAPGAADVYKSMLAYVQGNLKGGGLGAYDRRNMLRSIRSGQAARGLGYGAGDLASEQVMLDRATQARMQQYLQNAGLVASALEGNYNPAVAPFGASEVPSVNDPGIAATAGDLQNERSDFEYNKRNARMAGWATMTKGASALGGSFMGGLKGWGLS